jgi:hypothetical protein
MVFTTSTMYVMADVVRVPPGTQPASILLLLMLVL